MQAWLRFGTDRGICIASCPFTQGVDAAMVNRLKGHSDVMRQILEQQDKRNAGLPSPRTDCDYRVPGF